MMDAPRKYECGCPVVAKPVTWWLIRKRCPEHDMPVQAEPDADTSDFWVA